MTSNPVRFLVFAFVLLSLPFAAPGSPESSRMNVLFLVVDDLRPDLGSYGDSVAQTPALDRLAADGLSFDRAYCQIPSCGPSRASFLSGYRPDATRIFDNQESFRKYLPNATTLPQHFREQGWFTQSLGKVFHGKFRSEIREDPVSWSVPAWRPTATQYLEPQSLSILKDRFPKVFDGSRPLEEIMNEKRYKGPAWEAPDVPDSSLTDGRTAARAVEVLRELNEQDKPFFLAVGFVKPHAPFVAPKKYFDRIPRKKVNVPEVRELPSGTSKLASTSREMHGYYGVPSEGVFPESVTEELIVAYDACVSYIDTQVGKVIDELDRLGLRDNTLIVFTADHGYHLGEVGQWCKNTNFEEALRVPLIISSPRHPDLRGERTKALVELVDLHPTLSEMCGLPILDEVEGTSFATLFEDPTQPWKIATFGQHAAKLHDPKAPVGRSVRTENFRYVQWKTPHGEVVEEELYKMDGITTPNLNLASQSQFSETLEKMRSILSGGWRQAKPQHLTK